MLLLKILITLVFQDDKNLYHFIKSKLILF